MSFLFGYLGAASPPGWHPRGRCHHSAARQQHGGWVHSQTKWHQETLVEEPQEPLPGSDVKLDFLHCRMPLSKDVNELSSEAWYVTRSSHEGSPQWIAINLLSFLTVFSCCRHPKSQREVRRRRGGIEVWQRLLRVKRLKHIQKLQKQYKSNIKAYKSYRTGSFDMVEGMGA